MIRTTARRGASPAGRPATILPMLALTVVGLFSFLALAIDLGLLAVARTECQNAADAAALAATRTLDNKPGSSDNNRSTATDIGDAVVKTNILLAANFDATNFDKTKVESIRFGTYDYNASPSVLRFEVSYPATPPAGRSWTATEVYVKSTQPAFFGRVLGTATMATGARAVAVHRPRDVAVVVDMTGSMRFGSTATVNGAYLSPDPLWPQFGHYTRYLNYTANNPNAGTYNPSTSEGGRHNPFFTTRGFVNGDGELYAPNNYTVPTAGGPACVKDFFYDPGNLTAPATPKLDINPNMAAVEPNTPLPRAFHHWTPTQSAAGNPDIYIAPTNDYGGWPNDPANFAIYPCPETFDDQSHPEYLGDRHPRKKGLKSTTAAWDPLVPTGSAINLGEYLGWTPLISTGSSTPSPATGANIPAIPAAAPGRTWANFRDATWEKYGYDLDVVKYIADRGTRDPRTALATTGSPKATVKVAAERFKGYSMGPGYWGKTFFMWPPDPRWGKDDTGAAGGAGDDAPDPKTVNASNPVKDAKGNWIADWRRRFFNVNASPTATGSVDKVLFLNGVTNSSIFKSDAAINYVAVLKWVKQPPLALPPNLRAGRVLYYSSIPDDVDAGSGDDAQKADKAFWKNYIDYVVRGGLLTSHEVRGWPNGANSTVYESDLEQYQPPSPAPKDPRPYMHYLDNPRRPRAQTWFGPISMMAFLANGRGNAWAGTVHESQAWQLKAGMNSALDDIRNNHPNDSVGLAYFSNVTNNNTGDSSGYGYISVALGQEWPMLKHALFYPQSLLDSGAAADPTREVRAYDAANVYQGRSEIPNAQNGTDPVTGLAMAYNILTPSADAPRRPKPPSPYVTATGPRAGRRGAAKIVVFETDGVPNSYRDLAFVAQGYNSYYTVKPTGGSPGNGAAGAIDPALAVVDKIVAQEATTVGGLSTPNSPARVYAIGFGDLFSTPSATFQPTARKFLLDVQKRGMTSAATDTVDDFPQSQIITGASETRIKNLRDCFERIMQSGVQVTLIE